MSGHAWHTGAVREYQTEYFAYRSHFANQNLTDKVQWMQPCGGAIPLCMVDEFDLPADIIDRKVTKMKMISPSNREVDVGKTLSQTEYIGEQP